MCCASMVKAQSENEPASTRQHVDMSDLYFGRADLILAERFALVPFLAEADERTTGAF